MRKIRDADLKHLWDAYEQTGSVEDKQKITEAYFPLVKYLAERMASTLPASVEVDDLISMGTFGLIEAIDRFDRSRGFQFKTYCTARIRGAILDNLRTNDWVPRLVRLRTNMVDKTLRRLYAEYGREPTDVEMAGAFDMSMEEYEKLRKEASPTSMLSLTDDAGNDDGETGGRMLDLLGDKSAEDAPRHAQQRRDVRDLFFKSLNEKERIVVEYYYYEGLSMREIANMLRLTESRVCQIHSKVIRRLRELHENRRAELFV
ncbi:MAG: FliA/WhiG family RNA polymerase sigma factor [Planctomycetota bacterium]|nr:FliA/WhiG family RNA polymerase sigma factor [Planctomycetota bacterium]